MGAIMPELLAAAEELEGGGVGVDVVCVTSADLLFRAMQSRQGLYDEQPLDVDTEIPDELFPPSRRAPLVTVLDGHPHALAFLAAVSGGSIACLGVQDFGQSGDVQDLYRHFGIDTDTIVGTAFDLL
jgi:pyruvate dehydrogenase E1 component